MVLRDPKPAQMKIFGNSFGSFNLAEESTDNVISTKRLPSERSKTGLTLETRKVAEVLQIFKVSKTWAEQNIWK